MEAQKNYSEVCLQRVLQSQKQFVHNEIIQYYHSQNDPVPAEIRGTV